MIGLYETDAVQRKTVINSVGSSIRASQAGNDFISNIHIVTEEDPCGKCQRVMAYVMTPGREFGIPSEHYAEIIREGYQSAGFDAEILEEAIQRAYGLAEKSLQENQQGTGGVRRGY